MDRNLPESEGLKGLGFKFGPADGRDLRPNVEATLDYLGSIGMPSERICGYRSRGEGILEVMGCILEDILAVEVIQKMREWVKKVNPGGSVEPFYPEPFILKEGNGNIFERIVSVTKEGD